MNSLVLINKPIGIRSTQCVASVRKSLGGLKVGHAGTLDSTACGLLILLTGNTTRLCEYVMSLPKIYRVVIQFGIETDTCDYSGEIVSDKGLNNINIEAVYLSLYQFLGWRLQSPPAISAIKINGVSAHVLARTGQNPEMKSRPVFFRKINIITPYDKNSGTLELEVHCGRGTYIRSLARDLGIISGCGAHVKSLKRISIGNFHVDDGESPDNLDFKHISLSELAKNYTRIYVDEKDAKTFTNGMCILLRQAKYISRGLTLMNDSLCVEGDEFIGFGTYAGYDYLRPVVIVPKK